MELSKHQRQVICNLFSDKPIRKAYIFGSYARGDAEEEAILIY
jgi:predicted nucleotidyltransferase